VIEELKLEYETFETLFNELKKYMDPKKSILVEQFKLLNASKNMKNYFIQFMTNSVKYVGMQLFTEGVLPDAFYL